MDDTPELIEQKVKALRDKKTPDFKYSDLLLLLEHDDDIREVILNVSSQNSGAVKEDASCGAVQFDKESEVSVVESSSDVFEVKVDTLRSELSQTLDLLVLIENHGELSRELLGGSHTEGGRLLCLTVSLGRWSQIESVWDTISNNVKQRQQQAGKSELKILEGCLHCYNLTASHLIARLEQVDLTIDFNHKFHNRLNSKGKTISSLALPGLVNAAGKTTRKPLVITE